MMIKLLLIIATAVVFYSIFYKKSKPSGSSGGPKRPPEPEARPAKTAPGRLHTGLGEAPSRQSAATPDSLALKATIQHPYTRKYLELVGMMDGPAPNLVLDTGALKGVQNAADSWNDFDAWLRALVRACPNGEIRLFVPEIGEEYENAEMLCFTEDKIVTMALAKVTKVLSCGLRRTDGTLVLRALVEASDKPKNKDRSSL